MSQSKHLTDKEVLKLAEMKCTANVRRVTLGLNGREAIRCLRPIGHGGLHCFIEQDGRVIEFSNTVCFHPHYNIGG